MGWKDDMFWDGDPEQRLFDPGGEPRILKVCRNCKVGGLHWVKTEKGWRLHDSNENIHTCPIRRR